MKKDKPQPYIEYGAARHLMRVYEYADQDTPENMKAQTIRTGSRFSSNFCRLFVGVSDIQLRNSLQDNELQKYSRVRTLSCCRLTFSRT